MFLSLSLESPLCFHFLKSTIRRQIKHWIENLLLKTCTISLTCAPALDLYCQLSSNVVIREKRQFAMPFLKEYYFFLRLIDIQAQYTSTIDIEKKLKQLIKY